MAEPRGKSEGMNNSSERSLFIASFGDLLQILRARRVQALLGIGAVVLVATLLHFSGASYKSRSTLLVEREDASPLQSLLGAKSGSATLSISTKGRDPLERYVLFLKSHEFFLSVARAMAKDPALAKDYQSLVGRRNWLTSLLYFHVNDISDEGRQHEVVANKLEKKTSFEKSGFDNIRAEYSSKDPERSVRLLNFISNMAIASISAREANDLEMARKFIDSQMVASSEKLNENDSAVADFRRSSKVAITDNMPIEFGSRANALERSLNSNRMQMEQNNRLIAKLSPELERQEKELISKRAIGLEGLEPVEIVRASLSSLRSKKTFLLAQGLDANSQPMRELDGETEELTQRLKNLMDLSGRKEGEVVSHLYERELATRLDALKRENQKLAFQNESLERALKESLSPVREIPEAQRVLAGFARKGQMEFGLLSDLRRRATEIELFKMSLEHKLRVLEPATLASIAPTLRLAPKLAIVATFAAIGLIFLFCLLEFMNPVARSIALLEELGLPGLGILPRRVRSEALQFRFWETGPKGADTALKHARTRLISAAQATGAKTFCVLSERDATGTARLCARLAVLLSQMGKKTLLIDGNLRDSNLGEAFGVATDRGLATILEADARFEDVAWKSVLPGLDILPSGKSGGDVSDALASDKLKTLVGRLRDQYDLILFNSSPLFPQVDALLLSSVSDSLVFVAQYGETHRGDVVRAIEKLRGVGERPTYAVLLGSPAEEVPSSTQSLPGDGGQLGGRRATFFDRVTASLGWKRSVPFEIGGKG